MAAAAAEEYKDIHFDICFCSPLIRAKETAQIFLSARNIPIIYDDRIMEMCFGTYEGIENSFEIPDCPINVLFKDPVNYIPVENGESFEQLFARTGEFLRMLSDSAPLVIETLSSDDAIRVSAYGCRSVRRNGPFLTAPA